ncbi:MAG: hypothetical protein Q8O43_00940 [Dehalococcoidia bacterium]|nr:hypothetical protein [Dehalococcoidia bacterium]
MTSIVFSDEIVKTTELRKKQKLWLEKAYRKPITIPYKDDNLTIMNRAEAGRMLEQIKYITMLIEYWDGTKHGRKSKVFPWVNALDVKEQKEFRDELLETAVRCMEKEDWTEFRELLDDWKATAEAIGKPVLLKLARRKSPAGKYIALDE